MMRGSENLPYTWVEPSILIDFMLLFDSNTVLGNVVPATYATRLFLSYALGGKFHLLLC